MNEQSIFIAALERAPDERREFLDGLCADNAELRQRVERLLGNHEAAASFMDQPAGLLPTTIEQPLVERPGTKIGPYKLLEQIGSGGMGVVYVAEQKEPVRRTVALKVIKPGMDTREVIARFEAERQALAMMNHPHIAKVLDAGATSAGRPYFAMELVKGVPLTEFADQQRLDTRERLQLFITVCQAVQHAHQKGLIHRDLKPSNVLVEMHDVRPVPKVIDFGVAKAMGQQLTEKTLHTGFYQMLGTPMYMSPEQAGESSLDVDTRSDVYSLGVLLYELLTGTTPFDKETFAKVGLDEMRRIIREEEPPRPSKKISTLAAENISTVARNRRFEPRRLATSLRGDLDWIVMKALEKDRTRRYESADALAADLRRYLEDQPIVARPPSAGYRLRKFVRRKRHVLTSLCIFALLLPLAVYEASRILSRPSQPAPGAPPLVSPSLPNARASGRELPGLVPEPLFIPEVGRWQLITKRPRGVLRSAVWSHDEKLMALAEANHVRIYDASTPQLLHVLVGHSQPVTSVAWHPDGKRLASASEDGTVRLWTGDGIPTHVLKGHSGPVYKVAWRPDGTQLASAAADGSVRIWSAVDGEPVRVLDEAGRHVFGIDWSPDGQLLASVGGDIRPAGPDGNPGDNSVRVWDVSTGALIHKFDGAARHSGLWVDWRPDGKQLAVGYGVVYRSVHNTGSTVIPIPDAGIRLWNIDGTLALHLYHEAGSESTAELGTINAVAWHPTGKQLALGGRSGIVRLWKADDQSMIDTQAGHGRDLYSIAWKLDGTGLLTTSRESIREWDAVSRTATALVGGLSDQRFERVKWSPDGTLIAANYGAFFLDAAGNPVKQPERPAGSAPAWWEAPNENRRPDGTAGPKLEGTVSAIRRCAWSKNGWLAGASWTDASVRIWNDQGKLIATLKDHRGGVESVSWSPEGEMLASGGGDSVRLWKKDGTPIVVMTGHTDEVYPVAWSPDGQWIASGGTDSTVRLWKPDGTPGPVFRGHQGGIHDLAWSPDSKWLASASWLDSTLRVWNVETGKTEWQALKLSTEADTLVTLSASGQPLHGDRGLLESGLVYVVEKPNGAMDLLTFGDFRKRFANAFVTAYAERSKQASAKQDWERADAVFAESLEFQSDADLRALEKIDGIGYALAIDLEKKGEYLHAQQTAQTVVEVRRRMVANSPHDVDQQNKLAVINSEVAHNLEKRGQFSEAWDVMTRSIEILQDATERVPDDQQVRKNLARVYNNRGLCQGPTGADAALRDFARAIEINPDAIPFRNRAAVFIRLGRLEDAQADFHEALERTEEPKRLEIYLDCARRLERISLEAAIAMLGEAIVEFPDRHVLYQKRAEILRRLRRIDDAIADLQQAIRHGDKDSRPAAYWEYAQFLHVIGRSEDAFRTLDEGLVEFPSDRVADWHMHRASLCAWKGRFDDAANEVQHALRHSNEAYKPTVCLSAAKLLDSIGRTDVALALLDDAIAELPKSGPLWGLRGQILAAINEPARALADVERAMDIEPKRMTHRFERARLLKRLGKVDVVLDEARRNLERVTGESDRKARLLELLAALEACEKWNEAFGVTSRALTEIPYDEMLLITQAGLLRWKLDKPAEAIDQYTSILEPPGTCERNRDWPWIWLSERGYCHAQLGQYDQARADYDRALMLNRRWYTDRSAEAAAEIDRETAFASCELVDAPLYRRALLALEQRHMSDCRTFLALLKERADVDATRMSNSDCFAWVHALAPQVTDDFTAALAIARRLLRSESPGERGTALERHSQIGQQGRLFLVGALLYRAGNWDESLSTLLQSKLASGGAKPREMHPFLIHSFLAMNFQRLGQTTEARECYELATTQASNLRDRYGERLPWEWRLTLQLLESEAAQVLGGAGNREESESPRPAPVAAPENE